eukprot:391523-Pleurochrysis_carterae.AAC.1
MPIAHVRKRACAERGPVGTSRAPRLEGPKLGRPRRRAAPQQRLLMRSLVSGGAPRVERALGRVAAKRRGRRAQPKPLTSKVDPR